MSLLDSHTAPSSSPSNARRRRKNTSVSQIETQQLCLRKWWLQRVARFQEPERHHFLIGGRFHDVAERYLAGERQIYPDGWEVGLNPEEVEWAKNRVEFAIREGIWQVIPGSYVEWPLVLLVGQEHLDRNGIPLVGSSVVVEDEKGVRRIQEPTSLLDGRPLPAGWDRLPHLVGFIDHYIPQLPLPGVWDHKTAKNRRWGKKQGDIRTSTQMLVYPCVPFSQYPEITEVEAGYNVFIKDLQAKVPGYQIRDIVRRDESAARWQSVIEITETAKTLRETYPRVGDDTNPERAQHWRQVPGAVDIFKGNKKAIEERCGAFGGCPYRAMCFGQCSDTQLAHRLDQARKAQTNPPPQTQQRKGLLNRLKENTMPFGVTAKPTFKEGQNVYIKEEDGSQQYLAQIFGLIDTEAQVAFYPDPDIEPNWAKLPDEYGATLPLDALMVTADPNLPVANYQEALIAASMAAPEWEPLTTPDPVKADAPKRRPKANTGAPTGKLGQALSGKCGQALSGGIQSLEDEVMEAAKDVAPHAEEVSNDKVAAHKGWLGKSVVIKNDGAKNSFRGTVEAVTEDGIKLDTFGAPISWDKVVTIIEGTFEPIPGDEKDAKVKAEAKHLHDLDLTGALDEVLEIIQPRLAANKGIGKKDCEKVVAILERAKELGRPVIDTPIQAVVDHMANALREIQAGL